MTETNKEISNEIFELLKGKGLLERDAITILKDTIWMVGDVMHNHTLN